MKYFKDCKEIKQRKRLQQLMEDWKAVIKTKPKIMFSDDCKLYDAIEYFNSDGFFPGYYKAERKVLFVARESRYSSPCYSTGDRITTELENFKKGINPNTSSYWRRILYIIYGIQTNGQYSYDKIPTAKDILTNMVKTNNYGFAIMNISKYSNDSEYGATADFKLINQFLKDSELDKRNFISEEINLLDPDIIITANLWDGNIENKELEKFFPTKNFELQKEIQNVAQFWNYKLDNGKNIKLIDCWHFSKPGSDQKLFYEPVMDFLFGNK